MSKERKEQSSVEALSVEDTLKLALEALKTVRHKIDSYQVNVCDDVDEAINAAEKVLAQPEQEPFCYVNVNAQGDVTRTMKRKDSWCKTPLYTTPPQHVLMAQYWKAEYDKLKAQRTWVNATTWRGLTDDEMFKIWLTVPAETEDRLAFGRAVEAKLKEKNTNA